VIIKIIIAGYFIAPIIDLLLIKFFKVRNLGNLPPSFITFTTWIGSPILMVMPVVAIGLYFVNKISWYTFLIHSTLLLGYTVYRSIIFPEPFTYLFASTSILIILIIGILIRRDFRSPYFQILQRSWREKKRVPINHLILLNENYARITDLSESGCFVAEPSLGLKLGEYVTIDFKSDNLLIHCEAVVMRKTEGGFGIKFISLSPIEKKDIKRLIKTRYSLRYLTELDCKFQSNSNKNEGKILNISNTGCFIEFDTVNLKPALEINEKINIKFQLNKHSFNQKSKIVWINSKEEYNKPIGFGIKFFKSNKEIINQLKESQKVISYTR